MITKLLPNHNRTSQIHILTRSIQINNHIHTNRPIPITHPNTLLQTPLLHNQIKMPRNPTMTLQNNILTINPITLLLKVRNRQTHQMRPRLKLLTNTHNVRSRSLTKLLSNRVWKSLSEANHKMTTTHIVKCTQCQGLMLTTKNQKTKTCPYCNTHVNLQNAQKIAAANNAYEASEILKKLKTQQGFNHKP